MRELSDGEAVLIQFVMTPTGIVATEDSQDVFWGVGRVAVAAGSEVVVMASADWTVKVKVRDAIAPAES